jgi:hypothetical protein
MKRQNVNSFVKPTTVVRSEGKFLFHFAKNGVLWRFARINFTSKKSPMISKRKPRLVVSQLH